MKAQQVQWKNSHNRKLFYIYILCNTYFTSYIPYHFRSRPKQGNAKKPLSSRRQKQEEARQLQECDNDHDEARSKKLKRKVEVDLEELEQVMDEDYDVWKARIIKEAHAAIEAKKSEKM